MRVFDSASVLVVVGIFACPAVTAQAADPIATDPVAATWKFSADKGKTYTLDSLPALKPNTKSDLWGRVEFTIEDPAKIGALWFATKRDGGALAPVDENRIGRRYVSNAPTLLNAKITVNGKAAPFETPDMLVLRMAIDPKRLQAGKNVITFSGTAWNALHNARKSDSVDLTFRLMTSGTDALAVRSGPVLGPIGEDYFSLALRTYIPADVTVTVTPLEPRAEPVAHRIGHGTLHRARLPVPKGTRRFQYAVTTASGTSSKVTGPWQVKVPDPRGVRFVVMGQTATRDPEALARGAAALMKTDPDFIIHTGSLMIVTYWSAAWDALFFEPLKDVLATTPMLVVPAYRDMYSTAYMRLFVHNTGNLYWDQWSWGVGPVRFIGVDGWTVAHYPDAIAKWYEDRLKEADEPFLFSVTSYPGYTSNPFGRGMKGHKYDKEVLHPLLAKYKATAALGCTGKYEYVPAPNDKSVDSLITGGVGAPMTPGWNKYHYCIFEIKDNACTVKVVAYETGEVIDTRTYAARKGR